MPELPEVQGLADVLQANVVGRQVAAVHVVAFSALKSVQVPPQALIGGQVIGITRHGKWLDLAITTDDGERHLVFHLARAGWLRWHKTSPTSIPRPGRGPLAARVVLDEGAFDLTEAGTTKRLAVHIVHEATDVDAVATLGVEPLSPAFTREVFDALLAAKNQQIKGLLRDQRAIAGIGNAYSDEILHAARLSPFALTHSLDAATRDRVFEAVGQVLHAAIGASAGRPAAELKDAKRSGMAVHGRAGEQCGVCADVIAEVSFADSALQYCPTCQTGGKKLADRRMSKLLR